MPPDNEEIDLAIEVKVTVRLAYAPGLRAEAEGELLREMADKLNSIDATERVVGVTVESRELV